MTDPWAPLTPREQEIAHLVADGLTNKEIAERLWIAKRTVESHVESIFTKWRMRRRAEVARRVSYIEVGVMPP